LKNGRALVGFAFSKPRAVPLASSRVARNDCERGS
jgi:hypothetical protein